MSRSGPDTPDGLLIGDNVKVTLEGTVKYYEITNRDTIFYRDLHSALASGSTESYAEITNLNPPIRQLYQFYGIGIMHNVQVYIKQPASTNRWGTQRSPTGGFLTDRLSPVDKPMPINIWAIENYPPNIQLVNNTNISITPSLWWFGWRYQLKELKTAPQIFSSIMIGGINN